MQQQPLQQFGASMAFPGGGSASYLAWYTMPVCHPQADLLSPSFIAPQVTSLLEMFRRSAELDSLLLFLL